MIIFQEYGQLHVGKNGSDILKSMGQLNYGSKPIVMTDESGQIVATQAGTVGMAESAPLIKAMKDAELLKKSQAQTAKKTEKPLHKSFSGSKSDGFDSLIAQINELKQMQRRMFD